MMMDQRQVANQSILESCTSEIIQLDGNGTLVQISAGLCQILAIDPASVVGTQADHHSKIARLLKSEQTLELNTDSHTCYQLSHTRLPSATDNSEIHVFTNISTVLDLYGENQRLKEEAKQLLLIDSDTSLLTYRAMLLVLESQVSRCRRYGSPLSLARLAIEENTQSPDFKHRLMKVSRILKDQLRWSDLIARATTNEFLILLPETDNQAASKLMIKLLNRINKLDTNENIDQAIASWEKGMNTTDLLYACGHSHQQDDDQHVA